MSIRRVTFRPALGPAIRAASTWNPEAFVLALHDALRQAGDFVLESGTTADGETVRWVLMELSANSVLAPMGKEMAERTGLAPAELLDILGVNPVWGPVGDSWPEHDPADPGVDTLEKAVGCSLGEFLRTPLIEKFRLLGLTEREDWVVFNCSVNRESRNFEVGLSSDIPPHPEDREEIRKRFEDFEKTRRAVETRRRPFEDGEGMFRAPSFTGGGGVGLLACIRRCREAGLFLDFDEDRFRLADYSLRG